MNRFLEKQYERGFWELLPKGLTGNGQSVMLTTEVVSLLKKGIAFTLALLFAVGAHLRPVWDVELEGGLIAAGCASATVREAQRTAKRAAEEILPGDAAVPTPVCRLRLSLRRPEREVRALTDTLLRATEGVAVYDSVRVGGEKLGFVRDGEALREKLRGHIANTLPTWARGGALGRELLIRRQYTRAGYVTPVSDMLLLITGAAPVFYYDGAGRFALA